MLFSTCHIEGDLTHFPVSSLGEEGKKGINRINGRSQEIETKNNLSLIINYVRDLKLALVCCHKITSSLVKLGPYLELHF